MTVLKHKYLMAVAFLPLLFFWMISEVMAVPKTNETNDNGPICCYYYTANEANAECRPLFES